MAKRVGVKPTVMMTGGVAKNIGVIKALERDLGTEVIIPSDIDPQLVGALGAALIANEIFTKSQGGG
jgi:activator of 2-hydroxyglutaryl-CoA dehydratase